MNGYQGDISDTDEEEQIENEIQPGFIINVRSRKGSRPSVPKRHSKKRRLGNGSVFDTALPSPIHPEIDLSLTDHIFSSDFDAKRFQNLPRLPLDYFSSLRLMEPLKSGERSLALELKDAIEATIDTRPKSSPSYAWTSTSGSDRKDFQSLPFENRSSAQTLFPEETRFGSAQVISETSTSERAATTKFSKQYRFLEDGLALTDEPRLLIEAKQPHQVVHANAAFTRSVIGTSSKIQRWIERQNSPTIQKDRKLQKALRDIIPDPDIHLIVYPVIGAEEVSHYLVTTSDESYPKKRRRTKNDDASRAVG